MSETEAKTEGGPTDNTQKKKELEDKIAKASITGTEASLKCLEELKKINITLNQDGSMGNLPKIFKTVLPKFEEHSFTKIRNSVMKAGDIKVGGGPTEGDKREIKEFSQGGTGIIFQSEDKYYVYLVKQKKDKNFQQEIESAIMESRLKVVDVINISKLIDKDIEDIIGGGNFDDAIAGAARRADDAIAGAARRADAFGDDLNDSINTELNKNTPITNEQKARKLVTSGILDIQYGPGKKEPERALTKFKDALQLLDGNVSETAKEIKKEIDKSTERANKLANKQTITEGAFCEVISVKTDLSPEMPIKDVKLNTLRGDFTLLVKNPDEIDDKKARKILLDYQMAFVSIFGNETPQDYTELYAMLTRCVELIDSDPILQNSQICTDFTEKWNSFKKEEKDRDPTKMEKIEQYLKGHFQGTLSLGLESIQEFIDEAVGLKNTKKLGVAGVGYAAIEGVKLLGYPVGQALIAPAGQALMATISSHPVLAGIVVAVAIAAKHFKPGEPEDYITMYIGTELAPQLQIFERKQLTMKTGTTGDLGLTYTKFVTEVLAPKAKGYLTSSELISLITHEGISTQVTGDNFKKFETELTLKGSSLNLDSILGQTIEGKIDTEIAKLEANKKQITAKMTQLEGDKTQKQAAALEQQDRDIDLELKAKLADKTKFVKEKDTIKKDIINVLVKYLKGEYGSTKNIGGGLSDEGTKDNDLIKALTDLLKSEEIAKKIKDHILGIIKQRVKIAGVIEELKQINTQLEEVSPAVEQVGKSIHPQIYADFVATFGPKQGNKMFNKVFSSTIKRTRGAEENLATLGDDDRKADLDRVLVDENDITRMKILELSQKYKKIITDKQDKKKKEEEAKKAREAKLKGLQTGSLQVDKASEDVDLTGVTSSVTGMASTAYDKLSGLTDLMGKTGKDKTAEGLLETVGKDLQLPGVKKTKPDRYEPKDYKPSDMTTITKQELDDLREAEETLRKQLEMDREIMKQYKRNIEHDISEHYKVLKLKEEQLLQKSDHVVKEQQKIVSYYLGVLQNRESILLEQEKILEMKRNKDLEEIEEFRVSIQRGLVKALEKEKKHLLKHHGKQMKRQRSLLQEKLKDYKGDNLHLRKLLRKYHKDIPEKKRGSMTHKKKKKDMVVQKSFMNTFVN